MQPFYFLAGLTALVLLAMLNSMRQSLSKRLRYPYLFNNRLFTPAQRSFLVVLEKALGKEYRVYGKVRVADVIEVNRRAPGRFRDLAYDRMEGRSFDFLICDAVTHVIVGAVNLARRSRLGLKPPRDALDRICAVAHVPFVRFRESDAYSVVEVRERVFSVLRRRVREEEPGLEEAGRIIPTREEDELRQTRRAEPTLKSAPARRVAPTFGTGPGIATAPSVTQTRSVTLGDVPLEDEPEFRIGPGVEADSVVSPGSTGSRT